MEPPTRQGRQPDGTLQTVDSQRHLQGTGPGVREETEEDGDVVGVDREQVDHFPFRGLPPTFAGHSQDLRAVAWLELYVKYIVMSKNDLNAKYIMKANFKTKSGWSSL